MCADHDHRGEYADQRHDHDGDYAEKYHRHYDLERDVEALRRELSDYRQVLNEYERDLADARSRIRSLEQQTPQARQLQLKADQAAADLAASGYDRHGRDCRCPYCTTDEDEGDPDEPSNRELEPEPPGWYDVPNPEGDR
jgi:DNA repair exonuclease SbcCD ATPase subunit